MTALAAWAVLTLIFALTFGDMWEGAPPEIEWAIGAGCLIAGGAVAIPVTLVLAALAQ